MPRKGTTEEVAAKKAEKRDRDHQVKYGMIQTKQPKYKNCDFCGRSIIVNNYEDGKSRTPRWKNTQLIICPWCDPSNYTGKITKPTQYKTIMSRVLVEKFAEMNFCFTTKEAPLEDLTCHCLGCGARKIVAIKEERIGI